MDWLSPTTGFAFPSGHTANTTIGLGVLLLLYRRRHPGRRGRAAGRVVTVLIAVGCGPGRA